jgi:hypothetical protein
MKTIRPVETLILNLRGQKVLLDAGLAAIYGVPTKALNQAVKRNVDRFPEDFCFQLSADEWVELNRSQIVTGSQKHRDPRFLPRAFTEHGALAHGRQRPQQPGCRDRAQIQCAALSEIGSRFSGMPVMAARDSR